MKLRKRICPVAVLVVALAFLAVGTNAVAQGLQPPFMAPTPPSLNYGVFYFQVGAKYRNVDQFRFDVAQGNIPGTAAFVVNLGVVPFGPSTAGSFGVGTGKTGFDGVTAPTTWTYDNGAIFGTPTPAGIHTTCQVLPNPGVDCTATYAPDVPFVYSLTQPELGRHLVVLPTSDCCSSLPFPVEIGSFSIVDPKTQVNNLASISGTTSVTFTSAPLNGTLAYKIDSVDIMPDINRTFQGAVVCPSFEMGYQFSNFFDLFYGFSWFNLSNSMLLSGTVQQQGLVGNVVIQDTFPFMSDDTSAWPVFNFNSSDTVVGTDPVHNYRIATNGPGNGVLPNRQFIVSPVGAAPIENILTNIANTAEFTALENRFGARSWAPLYGLGRLGATLGTAVIPTYYKLSGSTSFTASGSSGTILPGTVLAATTGSQENWKTLYGLFVGGDLSMGNTGYFLYASADYMWATNFSYELGAVKTTFNPGGFTAGLSGGIQF
jgi:hypothetical protein